MSHSLRPHGLYSPLNSPGQNSGVGSCSLLQQRFPTQRLNTFLLHCRWIPSCLSHQGNPDWAFNFCLNFRAPLPARYKMTPFHFVCEKTTWWEFLYFLLRSWSYWVKSLDWSHVRLKSVFPYLLLKSNSMKLRAQNYHPFYFCHHWKSPL